MVFYSDFICTVLTFQEHYTLRFHKIFIEIAFNQNCVLHWFWFCSLEEPSLHSNSDHVSLRIYYIQQQLFLKLPIGRISPLRF